MSPVCVSLPSFSDTVRTTRPNCADCRRQSTDSRMPAVILSCAGPIATCSSGTVARRSTRHALGCLQLCPRPLPATQTCKLAIVSYALREQPLACSSNQHGVEVASRSADMHPQTEQHVSSITHYLAHSNLQQGNEQQEQAGLAMWLLLASWQLWAPSAVQAAEDSGLTYNPTGGEEFFKNVAGGAYILLVAIFLFRVLTRRAKRAREQRIAGSSGTAPDAAPEPPSVFEQLRVRLQQSGSDRKAGPLDAFLGAAQAGLLAAGLYIFSDKMQTVMDATQLPDAYTARNISITVRTILLGLCWLATFIFAANSVGLLGLTFQWLLFPDSMKDDEEEAARRAAAAAAQGPQLPKVGVSSKPDELRRAFQMAERLGKKEGAAAAASLASSGSLSDSDSPTPATSNVEPTSGSRT